MPSSLPPARIAAAVMAKLPRAGAVKTRLTPPLAPEAAAGLAGAFLADSLAVLRACPSLAPHFAVAGEPDQAAALAGPGIGILVQRGEDLAARMLNAVADLLAGHDGVLLFGADTLGLDAAALEEAAGLLALPGARAVLGASADGGYWLIGLKQADPRLFAGMRWSHPGVLADQLASCAQLGLPVAFARPLADCDTPADLAAAARTAGPRARAVLAGLAPSLLPR